MIKEKNLSERLSATDDIISTSETHYNGIIHVPHIELANQLYMDTRGLCTGNTVLFSLNSACCAIFSSLFISGISIRGIYDPITQVVEEGQLVRNGDVDQWCDQRQISDPFNIEAINMRTIRVSAPITSPTHMPQAILRDDSLQELNDTDLPPIAESPAGRAIVARVDPCCARTIHAPDTAAYSIDRTTIFISNGAKWFAMDELGRPISPL